MSVVKRSQLVVGQDYYLVSIEGGEKRYPATFKGRTEGGIYFECNVKHPYVETPLEQFAGCLGFMDTDELDGFYPVEKN